MHDKLSFLHKFMKQPKEIGSITPSSSFLARKMVGRIEWNEVSAIAELGAGTGVFTRHIEAAVGGHSKVLVFEQDLEMREQLARRFPSFSFYPRAQELSSAMAEQGISQLDGIISGLPFANFSQDLRDEIMDEVLASLKIGGTFVAFQYSLQMKSQLQRRFSSVDIAFAALNFPPAFVYCCKK